MQNRGIEHKSYILLEAAELGEGDRLYTECPQCGRAGKFMIVRDDDGSIGYRCFRNSCSFHGGGTIRGSGGMLNFVRTRIKKKFTPYTGELVPLTAEWVEYLGKEIGWYDQHFKIAKPYYSPEEHRVAFPIYSPMGIRRGYVLRSYSGDSPKTLTRMDCAEPHCSYYRTHGASGHVIVVEDIPSAVRAAVYTNALALNGTSVGPDYVAEIAAHFKSVTFALDADATAQALKVQKKTKLMFEDSRVLVLEQDIKNMKEEELCDLLKSF